MAAINGRDGRWTAAFQQMGINPRERGIIHVRIDMSGNGIFLKLFTHQGPPEFFYPPEGLSDAMRDQILTLAGVTLENKPLSVVIDIPALGFVTITTVRLVEDTVLELPWSEFA